MPNKFKNADSVSDNENVKVQMQNNSGLFKPDYVSASEFYSQIIDSLLDYSIFTVDNELNINSWNSGATNIFQYETNEIMGKQFETIFTKEDIANAVPQGEIDIAQREGRAVDNRWHMRKDGSKFFAYGLVFPLLGIEGKLLGYVKILRDLTESKKSEEAISKYISDLEELNAHKENILAILSHDLRSPLSRIISIAEFLKEDYDKMDPLEAKSMINMIQVASKEELNMLDYLVEWARIKYASQVFTPEKLKISNCVNAVFKNLSVIAAANSIILVNTIDEAIEVFADEKMMVSVFQNLLSNAVKHSNPASSVTVSCKQSEESVEIEIHDTGKGMSEEVLSNLFIPNLEALANKRKDDKGAGIGLLLTKGFIETNGGKIRVESEMGKGTSFFFTLPVNDMVKD
ncbi:MAG: PAS domain-containing sensor histidine kinase [Bacteroidota bacterium]|nr:PAS domain-containing sensor histidine kinase [Bacteroidota bacterium]